MVHYEGLWRGQSTRPRVGWSGDLPTPPSPPPYPTRGDDGGSRLDRGSDEAVTFPRPRLRPRTPRGAMTGDSRLDRGRRKQVVLDVREVDDRRWRRGARWRVTWRVTWRADAAHLTRHARVRDAGRGRVNRGRLREGRRVGGVVRGRRGGAAVPHRLVAAPPRGGRGGRRPGRGLRRRRRRPGRPPPPPGGNALVHVLLLRAGRRCDRPADRAAEPRPRRPPHPRATPPRPAQRLRAEMRRRPPSAARVRPRSLVRDRHRRHRRRAVALHRRRPPPPLLPARRRHLLEDGVVRRRRLVRRQRHLGRLGRRAGGRHRPLEREAGVVDVALAVRRRRSHRRPHRLQHVEVALQGGAGRTPLAPAADERDEDRDGDDEEGGDRDAGRRGHAQTRRARSWGHNDDSHQSLTILLLFYLIEQYPDVIVSYTCSILGRSDNQIYSLRTLCSTFVYKIYKNNKYYYYNSLPMCTPRPFEYHHEVCIVGGPIDHRFLLVLQTKMPCWHFPLNISHLYILLKNNCRIKNQNLNWKTAQSFPTYRAMTWVRLTVLAGGLRAVLVRRVRAVGVTVTHEGDWDTRPARHAPELTLPTGDGRATLTAGHPYKGEEIGLFVSFYINEEPSMERIISCIAQMFTMFFRQCPVTSSDFVTCFYPNLRIDALMSRKLQFMNAYVDRQRNV